MKNLTTEERKRMENLIKQGKHAEKVLREFTDHLNAESKKYWRWFDQHERDLGDAGK